LAAIDPTSANFFGLNAMAKKDAQLEETKRIMGNLLKMPPTPHKPLGKKKGPGEARPHSRPTAKAK